MMMRYFVTRKRFVFTTFILTTVYCLLTTASNAQVYPVLVNTTMRGPYSLNLTDYATPAYDRIQANLYLADITKNNYPVKVRLVIRSVAGINISTSAGNEIGPIYLDGGVNQTLTGSELYSLFDANRLNFSGISYNQYRANGLPEGNYQFHFEVVDAQFGVVISNINIGYANAWLILNDPPIINKPANGVTIVPSLPQNIFFQWTPRHTGSPNSAFTTEYDIQLVEIYPAGANANDVMLSAPIIFEKTTFATAYNYSIIDPNLIEGKWYAFRVRAHDQNGLDLFKNQGFSEVYRFYYGLPCSIPVGLQVESTGVNDALVSWNQDDNLNSVIVEYKALADKNWKSVEAFTNSIQLSKLVAGKQYQVRVAGNCSNNKSEYSAEKVITLAGTTATTCAAPQYYKIERTSLQDPNQKIKISWLPVPNILSYTVQLQGVGISKTYTKKAKDITVNKSGDDLFSTGSATGDYFSIEDQISNVPFTCTIEVMCADGSVMRGKTESVDLTIGNVSASSCELPKNLEVQAIAKSLTEVTVSWSTEAWFKDYKLRYRILGSTDFFTEITSTDAFVVLDDLQLDKRYEYQVIYTCLNGSMAVAPFNTFSIATDPSIFPTNPTGDCFPPVNFSYELKNTTATITWEKDKEVESYIVYWQEEYDSNWENIPVSGNNVDIPNLSINTTYIFNIKPVCKNSGLVGIASSDGKFTFPKPGIPNTQPCPTPILKTAVATGAQDVSVEVEASALYANFLIEVKEYGSSGTWMQLNNPEPLRMIDGLKANTVYEYRIAAFCGTVQSDFTATDTIRTLAKEDEFSCGVSSGYTVISSQTPIASLYVDDAFTAADFNLKVKSLTSERPYNGEAIGKVPYLKNSSFVFAMQDVWINDAGQMYAGKIYMKGTFFSILDPKLAAQIGSYIDKIEGGIEKAKMYAAMGDSIITSLKDVVTEANKPIDWDKYKGWSAEQLYNEGKRLVTVAEALLKEGTPKSISQGKSMLIEGIQLIKAAAGVTKSGVQLISSKVKGWLKKALDAIDKSTDSTKTLTEEEQKTLDPLLTQSLEATKDSDAKQYVALPDDEVFQSMSPDSTVESENNMDAIASETRLGDAYTKSSSYVKNQTNLDKLNKILMYITFYSSESNSKELVDQIQKDLADTLKGRKLDDIPDTEMTALLGRIEASINTYLTDKAKPKKTTKK